MTAKNRLKVKIGRSLAGDEKQAVSEFRQAIQQPDTVAVIFFCSSQYDLPRLGKQLAESFDCPLIGCTTAGEISTFGYQEGGIVGASLSSCELKVYPHLISPLNHFSLAEAERMASSTRINLSLTKGFNKQNLFGLILVDGLSMLEESTIAALYTAFDGLSIIGGSSGDDLKFQNTYIYDSGRFLSNAAVFAVFETTLPFMTFKTQHFQPTDIKLVITGADPQKRIITEINGNPAATEYARLIGMKTDELTPSAFSKNPLLLKIGGEWHVRAVSRLNSDNSLNMFSAIEEGLVLTIGRGVNIIKNFTDQVNLLKLNFPGNSIFILCDCILRRLELKQLGLINEISYPLQSINAIGFSTYGEQFNSIHVNQTLTGIIIGE
ncbi:MAG: FIST N domain protein [Smithella sp. PtaU1.Bin162]|nr:MAG: FIST N domain protein [Smithella sp. PtaU1.Bin162]